MMDIIEFQEQVVKAFSEMDELPGRRAHTKQSAVIHLMEEIGEIARQVTNEFHRPERFDRLNFGTELADSLMFIVFLAELYDVDISSEMTTSIRRVESKIAEVSSDK